MSCYVRNFPYKMEITLKLDYKEETTFFSILKQVIIALLKFPFKISSFTSKIKNNIF